MWRSLRAIVLLFACLGVTAVWGQALEVIGLQHRTAEDLLPQLRPFVEPGGALTGMQDKLFLRASRRNAEEVRRIAAELDVPQRRLMISVRQESEEEAAAQGGAVAGGVTVRRNDDGGAKVSLGGTARVYSSDRAGRDRVLQSVQTIDGGRASIVVGQSYLLPFRQVVRTPAGAFVSEQLVQRDVGTGFMAMPRLAGDRVTVEISPMHDTPGATPGAVNVQRLTTTLAGTLGEWLVLGGASSATEASESGTRWSTRGASGQRRLLLKIEELR